MSLFYILVFPRYLFLVELGLAAQFIDRKLYARMQNRMGPPLYQPFADLQHDTKLDCLILGIQPQSTVFGQPMSAPLVAAARRVVRTLREVFA